MPLKRNIGDLDLDRLQEVLDYDPETGVLAWLKRLSPRCKLGEPAGNIGSDGYRRIIIDKKKYPASHLAWFHFYGTPPDGDVVDFINLDKTDTRIANLRLATFAEDARNRPKQKRSSTGLKGAARFYNPHNRARYRAMIRVDGKRIFIGLFHTAEEAYAAYCAKVAELHGKFARTE